jgi:hypothetical protein
MVATARIVYVVCDVTVVAPAALAIVLRWGLRSGVGAFEVDRTMLGAYGEKEAWYPWVGGGARLWTEGALRF